MGQSFGQLPAGLTWATNPGMGQPTLLTQNGPIYIRGTNPDGSMIFQAAPQQTITAQPGENFSCPFPIISYDLSSPFQLFKHQHLKRRFRYPPANLVRIRQRPLDRELCRPSCHLLLGRIHQLPSDRHHPFRLRRP